MQLAQNILGTTFQNPLVVASGKWSWEAKDWRDAENAGAGAITTKSFWPRAHEGNPEPTVVQTAAWTLNAVGLPDHGPEHSGAQLTDYLPKAKVPLIISIVGLTPEDIAVNVRRLAPLKPAAFEVNLSSPTFLKLRGSFFDENAAEEMVKAACAESDGIPVVAKLSPMIPAIGAFAVRCVKAGAQGITAINTVGPALAIDVATRKPILSARYGGVSGPGIKPIALRCVADIYQATDGTVPIIGTGGVMTGVDVAEMLLAGASLVGMATAIHSEGMGALTRIGKEFETWCAQQKVENIAELIGGIHR